MKTRPSPPPAPTKKLVRATVLTLAVGVLSGLAGVWWINSAPASSTEGAFVVLSGASAVRVAALLEEGGRIRSRRWFLWLIGARGAAAKLHAGVYRFRETQSATSILADLMGGQTRRIPVTIPEGFASWQIAERLEAHGICPASEFKAVVASGTAEGYLFPETYYLEEGLPARMVAELMRGQFEKVWSEVLREAVSSGTVQAAGVEAVRLGGKTWARHEVVTLASLVEREARRPEERALISAVYHNRLKKRMPLEADPTIQFSLGFWKERVVFQDLETDSAYNTYRRRGLPPGPICSPGRRSLEAALSPAQADDLYFVADVSGGHHFSSGYSEHQKKVQQWNKERRLLRIEKIRKSRKDSK